MEKLKNLVIDSATPIAAATTTVAAAALFQKLTKTSLGFSDSITDGAKLVGIISIINILADKYNIY